MRRVTGGLVAAALMMAALIVAPAATAQPPSAPAAPTAEKAPPTPEQIKAMMAAEKKRFDDIQATFKPQHGVIPLPDAKASLNLGDKYYFIGPADSRKALVDAWGNPPTEAEGVLGMIFPEGKTLWENDYAVIVTFNDIGLVDETITAKEDYDKVLQEMHDGEAATNEERAKGGYEPIHIVGWAQPPTYDSATHNLIWARELAFGDSPDHTLNYDVRHLGRHGVLSMNFVSKMTLLPDLRPAAAELARTAEFDAGARYADKQAGDKKAGIGLAGLVGAGAGLLIAKKVGLIGILLLFLKKGAVVLLAGMAGVGAWFRKLFGLKPKTAKGPAVADFGSSESVRPPPDIVS